MDGLFGDGRFGLGLLGLGLLGVVGRTDRRREAEQGVVRLGNGERIPVPRHGVAREARAQTGQRRVQPDDVAAVDAASGSDMKW